MTPGRARGPRGRGRSPRSASGPRALRRPAEGVPPPRFAALTTDVWYTLFYLLPRDQRSLEARRTETWSRPLLDGGLRPRRARAFVTKVQRWAANGEDVGHTPTIAEQARQLARWSGVPVDPEEVGRRLDAVTLSARVRVARGATAALERLRQRGVRLGVVSNVLHETGPGARALLEKLGVDRYFDAIVLSAEHPWSKPRPEPFRRALRTLGVRPSSAAHVGDLTYDIVGARRAGLTPVLFTGLHRYEPARLGALWKRIDPDVERVARWSDLPGMVAGPPRSGHAGSVARSLAERRRGRS